MKSFFFPVKSQFPVKSLFSSEILFWSEIFISQCSMGAGWYTCPCLSSVRVSTECTKHKMQIQLLFPGRNWSYFIYLQKWEKCILKNYSSGASYAFSLYNISHLYTCKKYNIFRKCLQRYHMSYTDFKMCFDITANSFRYGIICSFQLRLLQVFNQSFIMNF